MGNGNGNIALDIPAGGSSYSLFPDGVGFGMLVFLWREENLRNLRQTLSARTRTNNKLYPHVKPGLGIELRSQWWEACILKCQ